MSMAPGYCPETAAFLIDGLPGRFPIWHLMPLQKIPCQPGAFGIAADRTKELPDPPVVRQRVLIRGQGVPAPLHSDKYDLSTARQRRVCGAVQATAI